MTGNEQNANSGNHVVSEPAPAADECPPSSSIEDRKATESRDGLNDDVSAVRQQAVCQPTHRGRGRPPKNAKKNIPVKTDDGRSASNVSKFQDDPSDADYTTSKCTFISFEGLYNDTDIASVWPS